MTNDEVVIRIVYQIGHWVFRSNETSVIGGSRLGKCTYTSELGYLFLFSLQQIQNCIIWTEANRIFDKNGSKNAMSHLHLRDESDSKF